MEPINRHDQGVVLYLRGTASGTYVDRKGVTRSVGALTQSYQASDEFYVGRGQSLLLTLQGVLGGVVTASVALQIKRIDASGLTWRWATAIMERIDTGALGASGVNAIAAADLLDPDGVTAADVVFGTTNTRASGLARLIVKADAAPAATDRIALAVDVG